MALQENPNNINGSYVINMNQAAHSAPPQQVVIDGIQVDSAKLVQNVEATIRLGFIRKVFALLTLQLLVAFGIVALFSFYEPVGTYATQPENRWLYFASAAGMLACMLVLVCSRNLARRHPHNLVLMALFTLCTGTVVGVVSANYAPETVAFAMGVTVAVALCLILFASQTKVDITGGS